MALTTQAGVDLFVAQQFEVAAGVRQQLEIDMQRHPNMRLLPERFMVIRQALGLARNRGEELLTYLSEFVEEIKANGEIAQALARHGIQGALVAPAHIS